MLSCPRRCRVVSFLTVCLVGVAAFVAVSWNNTATAKPPLGRRWPAGQQISIDQINHTAFNKLLKKYVDRDGYVDYQQWHRTTADRTALLEYLDHLSRANRELKASRAARIAFWINAYNAVTIEGILQVYPTTSIRNHTAKVVGYNIWKDLPLLVGGQAYSLDAMEHQILRKMNEPRIHFAIVCASVGCPPLRAEAWDAKTLDAQLTANARAFFANPQNFRVDEAGNTISLSSILDWFGKDFGKNTVDQLRAVAPYFPENAGKMSITPQTQVRYLNYDWQLNDQQRKPVNR